MGLASGGMLAFSVVGFRGAILSLGLSSYVMAATFTLCVGLLMQAVLLSLYLWLRQPAVLAAIVAAWRPSLFAGFMGALASQFWFLAFALATAASVRTLALVVVLFALHLQAGDDRARDFRHCIDRDRGGDAVVDALTGRRSYRRLAEGLRS